MKNMPCAIVELDSAERNTDIIAKNWRSLHG